MADDDEVPEVDVPLPHVRPVSPIHKGNARKMAERKAQIEREKRADLQRQRKARAMSVLGSAAEEATIAADSQVLKDKTNEELADAAVRRMAMIVLLGGEAFAPTSLREASEAANQWANIAYKEAVKRKAVSPEADELTPAAAAAASIKQMKKRLREASAERTG